MNVYISLTKETKGTIQLLGVLPCKRPNGNKKSRTYGTSGGGG